MSKPVCITARTEAMHLFVSTRPEAVSGFAQSIGEPTNNAPENSSLEYTKKNIYQKCIRRYIQIHPRYANIYQDIQNSTLRRGRPARPRSGPGGAAPLPLRILYILVHIVVCLGYIWMRLGAHEAWCFTQLFIGCSCIHACIYVCMYVNHFIPTSESCGCFGCWDIEYISY